MNARKVIAVLSVLSIYIGGGLLLASSAAADENEKQLVEDLRVQGSPSSANVESTPTNNANLVSNAALAGEGPKGDDEANKGLDEVFSSIKEALRDLIDSRKMIENNLVGIRLQTPGYEEISKNGSQYIEYWDACRSQQANAAYACLENYSENLHGGVAVINTLLSTVGSAAVNDSCSKFAKAMDAAKAALTAYTAACGLMKARCGWSCVKSESGLSGMETGLKKAKAGLTCDVLVTDPNLRPQLVKLCEDFSKAYKNALERLAKSVPEELKNGNKKSIAGKAAVCTGKYALLLASAGTGIFSLANSLKQGKECEKNSDGTAAVAETKVDKCADAEKAANDPECICKANPRTPGCANSYQKANEGSLASLSTGPTGDLTTGATGGALAGSLGSSGMDGLGDLNGSSDSGSGIAGAPVGGGGGGLSGFGGGGGGAGGDRGEAGKKGLNTDILSGAGGGGGGGFGGYRGAASDSKYRQYLPGGDKDPNKAMAGQQAWTKEVTGQGGKSNFEKVKERYRDNKGTLLNN